MDTKRMQLRALVRGAYDLQKMRIEAGNRIVANLKVRLGQEPGTKEDESLTPEGKALLEQLRRDYKRITDGVVSGKIPTPRRFKPVGIIATYTELVLAHQYVKLLEAEEGSFRGVEGALNEFPIWTKFLKGVKGIGPAMAGVIVSEIDIAKARYPSSLWRYAGFDVAGDGRGRSRRAEHLVEMEYTAADGERKTRRSITFNPFLKTKLYVLATSFLKQGGDHPYRAIYDAYKHRLETHPEHAQKTKGHRHNMAMRYMIKMFLLDLYTVWRPLDGLPVAPPYHEAKLGMVHRAAA